jgi:uncharacterized protein (TIGR00255 family)
MLKSMTGFGRGEVPYGDGSVTVEVTTVNARYLDVSVRGLREHGSLELKVRAYVGERLARGAVSVNVAARGATPVRKRVAADVELAREYVNEFDRLRYALGLKGRFPVEALTSRECFLVIEEEGGDEEAFTESVLAALGQALERAVEMREGEGAKLAADLATRLGHLEQLVDDVAARAPAAADAYRKRLTARAQELAESATVDPARLEAEVALFAERSDISEEVTRCRAHTRAFAENLAGEGRVGRRLDFLTVEINREANTIAAKAQDAQIASSVIEIKDLLEQMREQVQNIE